MSEDKKKGAKGPAKAAGSKTAKPKATAAEKAPAKKAAAKPAPAAKAKGAAKTSSKAKKAAPAKSKPAAGKAAVSAKEAPKAAAPAKEAPKAAAPAKEAPKPAAPQTPPVGGAKPSAPLPGGGSSIVAPPRTYGGPGGPAVAPQAAAATPQQLYGGAAPAPAAPPVQQPTAQQLYGAAAAPAQPPLAAGQPAAQQQPSAQQLYPGVAGAQPAQPPASAGQPTQQPTQQQLYQGAMPQGQQEGQKGEGEGEEPQVDYSVSGGFAERLANLGISMAVTSYQSGLLYLIGRNSPNGIHIHQTALPRPMGVCLDRPLNSKDAVRSLTLVSGFQILRFENVLGEGQIANESFDVCYAPRRIHYTGNLDSHDVGVDAEGRPVFVNTRFNCLSVPSTRHSFETIWRPKFISDLVDEDRCHLNGLAMLDGKPKYVTAVSRSDTIDGWRDRRSSGGIVIDVETDEVVCNGLSMPHSPRMHRGNLWILNAGTGELGVIEFKDKEKQQGEFKPKVFCPGFLRGLRFYGNLAFVGLSKPRYKRFEGLALDERLKEADSEPWCGVQIIDLARSTCVDWFRIDGNIGELYDIEVIPGATCPMALTPSDNDMTNLITFDGMPVEQSEDQPAEQQPAAG